MEQSFWNFGYTKYLPKIPTVCQTFLCKKFRFQFQNLNKEINFKEKKKDLAKIINKNALIILHVI